MIARMLLVTFLVVASPPALGSDAYEPSGGQDVPFVETPDYVVQAMLELAAVDDGDVVYDLGSGDGRIVIAAAREYGSRAVGIEIHPELVERSEAAAREAGVDELVRFEQVDFFEADIREATVVAIYLHPKVNRRLKPLFLEQLEPGTRVVSHRFEIPGWRPDRKAKAGDRRIYLYLIE